MNIYSILFTFLFVTVFYSCQSETEKILFSDPLDGRVVEGWKVAPDNFIDHPEFGKLYLMESDSMFAVNPPWIANPSWSNYRVEIELLTNGGHWFGLDFNVDESGLNSNNIQFFTFDTTQKVTVEGASIHGSYKGAVSWKLYPFADIQPELEANKWIRLRIDVGNNFANCYLNDSLVYTGYDFPYSQGGIRFASIMPAKVYLRNFKVTALDKDKLKPLLNDVWLNDREYSVDRWEVSNPFPADSATINKSLTDIMNLATDWQAAETDSRGVVNLGLLFPKQNKNHSILARKTLTSPETADQKIWITYTDRCKIYCNGELVFTGPKRAWNDPEANHDCRLKPRNYKVTLPLNKGDNEIILQTQTFEPWGWGFAITLEE